MKPTVWTLIFVLATVLSGEASARKKMKTWYGLPSVALYVPIIDPASVDADKYQQDLAECREIALPVEKEMIQLLVNRKDMKINHGAVYGAMLVGGAAGGMAAAVGSRGQRAGGALAGALTAAVVASSVQDYRLRTGLNFVAVTEPKRILENCLAGRGYNILNTTNYNGFITWEEEDIDCELHPELARDITSDCY